MTRAMFLVLAALPAIATFPAIVTSPAIAQSPAPAAVPEVAAGLPRTPVEVSAVKENGVFRFRTTTSSLALYTYDLDSEDRSACTDRCAENWPPVIAPAGSAAMGDWKPIARTDGRLQWTFGGRPVYSYRGDTPTRSTGDGLGGQWHLVPPITYAPVSVPAAAAVVAGNAPAIPAGVGIGKSATGAPIFTDPHGYALYAFDRDAGGKAACLGTCARTWPPLIAEPGSKPVGDWTVSRRGDGTAQWAYQGRPAYLRAGDRPNGGDTGHGREGVWHLITF